MYLVRFNIKVFKWAQSLQKSFLSFLDNEKYIMNWSIFVGLVEKGNQGNVFSNCVIPPPPFSTKWMNYEDTHRSLYDVMYVLRGCLDSVCTFFTPSI